MIDKASGSAHGRVNLIGEHTDYNGGFVLPTLIPQQTTVSAQRRADQEVHIRSSLGSFQYQLGKEKPSQHWSDYVLGVTHVLAKVGHRLSGMDLEISSNIPIGSGLSSSAALNLAVMHALRELFGLDLSDRQAAPLCQQVENEFVGARVGIMDPMACALALPGHALFVDTRSLQTENIPLPSEASLIVIHSGISHRNVGGGYNERRAQCELAAKTMGVTSLRDIDLSRLQECEKILPEVVFRRVKHVLTENERVLQCVQALKTRQLDKVGELFDASHRSMRDDYEVSLPEVDCLVECIRKQVGMYGARLTGGGFGGSIVALVRAEHAAHAAGAGAREYAARTGQTPKVMVPQ